MRHIVRRILRAIFYLIDHLPELVLVGYLALLFAALVRFLIWLVNLL